MPQLEHVPQHYDKVQSDEVEAASLLHLRTVNEDVAFSFTFDAIQQDVFLVTFTSQDSHPLPPYPSIPGPSKSLNESDIKITKSHKACAFEFDDITAHVDWTNSPVLSLAWTNSGTQLHADLPYRSYAIDGDGIAHYTRHDREALHVGLGEASAPMDLTARSFKIDATDCFGYDVYNTNPMYKHMPILVKATPHGCVAIVSSSYSRASWSVGAEIDGLWGRYKVYRQDYGGLQEYLIVGKTLKDIVRTYAELVGFPLLAPRWSFGYLSGGYKYTMMDAPPAHQALLDFADKLEEHRIPCSGHQMSSGYSISEVEPKVRNVFTWNKHRFPDPEAWIAKYHAKGIRLLTNIKPFILASHPKYGDLVKARGMFIESKTGVTASVRLWSAGGGESDLGGHLDFTSSVTADWWCEGVRKLCEQGIDGMWNDNNEYTLSDDRIQLSLEAFKSTKVGNMVGQWGRAMQTELMGKASYDGLLAAKPNVRPFVLTRSAGIGTLRYCCSSWSGDNMTSWKGMKGANALSLTAGVALLHNYGHDIGGFEGPQPSPELLLRWIQLGIYGPRFAINCFKTSPEDNSVGEVIEPWMYPEITPLIRKAIKRRYEIMPYIYSLGLESHLEASPPQRWIGWNHEQDPEVWTTHLKRGEEQYWFGDTLLVGGVYEPNISEAKVYLPRKISHNQQFDFGYVNLNAPHQYLASGQWITISSPWREHIPVLARIGGAIPIGKSIHTEISTGDAVKPFAGAEVEEDDYRGIEIFPPKGSSHGTVFSDSWYEDDGMSLHPDISKFTVEYSSTEEKVMVKLSAVAVTVSAMRKRENDKKTRRQGEGETTNRADDDAVISSDTIKPFIPSWTEVVIILPHGDSRHVMSATPGETVVKLDSLYQDRAEAEDRDMRVRYRFPAPRFTP